jgi:hypothetical protein
VREAALAGGECVRLERNREANLYIGAYDLERNFKETALKLFQSATIVCPQDFLEQAAAKLELTPLGSPAR